MPVDVKICGLNTPEAVSAAADAGARAVGFNFYPPSPRAVSVEGAVALARLVPGGVNIVALLVDADDDRIDSIVSRLRPAMLQLHGDEPPRRVAEIQARFQLPVMKAIRVATSIDLAALPAFEEVADWILFDAKAPGAALPGGNGAAFDWRLLQGLAPRRPWMLSGGLTADNLAEAVATSRAKALDVSSGVEDAPGVKSPERIRAFLAAAAGL